VQTNGRRQEIALRYLMRKNKRGKEAHKITIGVSLLCRKETNRYNIQKETPLTKHPPLLTSSNAAIKIT
jgi:hypothetical protein